MGGIVDIVTLGLDALAEAVAGAGAVIGEEEAHLRSLQIAVLGDGIEELEAAAEENPIDDWKRSVQ